MQPQPYRADPARILRRSFVEVFVPLDGLFQIYNGNVDRLGNFDLVMQDRHHQLPVVLQHWTLTGGEGVGFRPAQSDADAEISMLSGLVEPAGVVGHIETGNSQSAACAANRHQRIQNVAGASVWASWPWPRASKPTQSTAQSTSGTF